MNNQNLDTKQITDVQKKAEDAILNNFLNDINSLCLLDTGLGKTRIACEVLNALLFEIKKNNSYALIFYNQKDGLDSSWEKELKQLNLEYEVLSGKNFNDFILTSEEDKFFPHKEKIFLLSYELLISYYTPMKKTSEAKIRKADCFAKNPPYFAVFDEFHRITNGYNNEYKLTRNTINSLPIKYKLGLTATGTVNNTEEIAIAKMVLNGDSKTSEEKISNNDFIFKDLDNIKEKLLEFTSHRFLIDLPLRDDEKEAIRAYNKPNIRNSLAVENILMLGKYKGISLQQPSTRILILRKIIESLPTTDKVVILCNYIEHVKYLSRLDWLLPYAPVSFHGRLAPEKRADNMKRFDEAPDCRILIATEKIAGTSLNLQNANQLICFGLGWTPAEINQITGRINRTGQEKNTFCYIITCNRNKSADGFVNENDAKRFSVVEQKNKEQKDFLAANEFDKYERINFSDSKKLESEFQKWIGDIQFTRIEEAKAKSIQTDDFESRRQLVQETIKIVKEITQYFITIPLYISYTGVVNMLENYDLRTYWEEIKPICQKYILAYSNTSNKFYFVISKDGSILQLYQALSEYIGTTLSLSIE